MLFYQIRDLIRRGSSLKDIPLRVTFYARVSTSSEEQLNSLDNQILYFEDYIRGNSNWTYIPGYIDEGISGSTVKGRKKFLKMINDAKMGKFDLIVTKEVSRFSRNLLDSIHYTQELMRYNVGVYFQTNGINTYDTNAEFILNMMSSLAQEEVKRLSERVKWGANNAMKRGRVLGSGTFGYIKNKTKLEIDEKESKIVKLIFNLYATGEYGMDRLGLHLYELGIKNTKGNVYDASTLKSIIRNPKYKGYYQGHTTEVVDYKTKKRVVVDEKDRILYKDENIPQIVSEELWNRANEILKSRYTKAISNTRQYSYSGLLYCKDHNKVFTRSTGSKRSKSITWACSNYMKYRLKACRSPLIKEEDLNYIFKNIFSSIFSTEKILDELLALYEEKSSEKKNKQKSIKKSKLLDLYLNGNISKEEYCNKLEELTEKEAVVLKKKNIKEELQRIFLCKENIGDYMQTFVEKIMVNKIDYSRKNICLEIALKSIMWKGTYTFDLANYYTVIFF